MHRATGAGCLVASVGAAACSGESRLTMQERSYRHFSARVMWKVSGDPQSHTGMAELAADVNDQCGEYGRTRLHLSHVNVLIRRVRGCSVAGAVLHRVDSTQAHEQAKV